MPSVLSPLRHILSRLLSLPAAYGRQTLLVGLVIGVALPELGAILSPFIAPMIVLLVYLSALRIPDQQFLDLKTNWRFILCAVLVLQLAVPLMILLMILALMTVVSSSEWSNAAIPFLLAGFILMAAPSIAGAPSFMLMLGRRANHAFHLLIIGTLMVPLTSFLVFNLALLDYSGGFGLEGLNYKEITRTALILLLTIIGTSTLAALTRRFAAFQTLDSTSSGNMLEALFEGLASILLALLVIALMTPLRTALIFEPLTFILWLAFVFAINFGLQSLVWFYVRHKYPRDLAMSLAMIAGNRNIALFLLALPVETLHPLYLFIGCYQIPMYCTPFFLGFLSARWPAYIKENI